MNIDSLHGGNIQIWVFFKFLKSIDIIFFMHIVKSETQKKNKLLGKIWGQT
jgi:hypothetical protein